MRIALAAMVGFLLGAVLAWAVGVFLLQLHWETTLLVIEATAVAFAGLGALVVHRRNRVQRP